MKKLAFILLFSLSHVHVYSMQDHRGFVPLAQEDDYFLLAQDNFFWKTCCRDAVVQGALSPKEIKKIQVYANSCRREDMLSQVTECATFGSVAWFVGCFCCLSNLSFLGCAGCCASQCCMAVASETDCMKEDHDLHEAAKKAAEAIIAACKKEEKISRLKLLCKRAIITTDKFGPNHFKKLPPLLADELKQAHEIRMELYKRLPEKIF